uniref:Glycolipid transfer protein domain-containing protein n=2 Tax=Grammatophora oceanica TaxID=210454 RepID=A0A7S1VI52_9STRA|mmetsp:Transcript_45738/g.68033  ORF Transcript_45738/g.68033 Transcript_45738/m.68033 type:complete len:709 (+) Transcript_45738:180-2306(+)
MRRTTSFLSHVEHAEHDVGLPMDHSHSNLQSLATGLTSPTAQAAGALSVDEFMLRMAIPASVVIYAVLVHDNVNLHAVERLFDSERNLLFMVATTLAILAFILATLSGRRSRGAQHQPKPSSSTLRRQNPAGRYMDAPTLRQVPSVQFMESVKGAPTPLKRNKNILKDPSTDSLSGVAQVSSAASLMATSAANLVGLTNVGSTASLARLSAAVKRISFFSSTTCDAPPVHISAVSASTLFVDLQLVAELTLEDITTLIRYSVNHRHPDFDDFGFLSHLSYELKEVMLAMDAAASESRGMGVLPSPSHEDGDMDVLLFCAAMRIFVEWRSVRQVPEGYQAYAVGLSLGRRDLVQNIAKIETAVHRWIDEQREKTTEDQESYSPSVCQLLQYEVDHKMHPHQPKLADNTAALGVVWMIRQVEYQSLIFSNMLDVPNQFDTAIEAVTAAYSQVFDSYHGWIIRKTFLYSFKGAPPAVEIFHTMNPVHLARVLESMKNATPLTTSPNENKRDSSPIPGVIQCSFDSGSSDDGVNAVDDAPQRSTEESKQRIDDVWGPPKTPQQQNPIEELGKNIARGWDEFAGNVDREWNKFLSHFDPNKKEKSTRQHPPVEFVRTSSDQPQPLLPNIQEEEEEICIEQEEEELDKEQQETGFRLSAPSEELSGEALDLFVEKEMTKEAHYQISTYLHVMNPILSHIKHTIDELNLNDPTKV